MEINIKGRTINIFKAETIESPLVILNDYIRSGGEIYNKCKEVGCPDFTLAEISGLNWYDDMTPWPVSPVGENGTAYGGKADEYLYILQNEIIPAVRTELGGKPKSILLAGYSLAGLFALYAATKCEIFQAIASCSGSLWFPGFKEYILKFDVSKMPNTIYFSLGDREARTKNKILRTVENSTGEIVGHLSGSGINTAFELNKGDHFQQAALRTAKGICWILEKTKMSLNHSGIKASAMREEIFKYVKNKYGVEPDYPLPAAPSFPVMRHKDNRKWFAIIMSVSREKLGLDGSERVDIINVKLGDPLLVDLLTQQKGFFRGYHISRGNWISVLLDGTVPAEEICRWIDESFAVTESRQSRQSHRPPKEWIIPANPKYYDIVHAFDDADEIDWKQGKGIKTGDTVFLYAAAPISGILYQCRVTKTDIPFDFVTDKLSITGLMKIRLIKRYRPKCFTFERLKKEYGILTVRGPRSVPRDLSHALNQ
ncbi:MAG: MmcQ/YjbR family DNA-binding protein [Clostridia bacterium]|nr:MmcQ/YjbR family DNA-binding protein [Clostridia bacterium]